MRANPWAEINILRTIGPQGISIPKAIDVLRIAYQRRDERSSIVES